MRGGRRRPGDRLAHPGQIEEPLHHRSGTLHQLGGSGERHRLTPEGDPHSQRALELQKITVVYPRKEQRIGALSGHSGVNVVSHVWKVRGEG